jgi:hypothetical protein
MPRPTVRLAITSKEEGLGYCCPWLFFQLFPSTGLVARRLGFSERRVYEAKIEARAAGCGHCAGCANPHLAELKRRAAEVRARTEEPQ